MDIKSLTAAFRKEEMKHTDEQIKPVADTLGGMIELDYDGCPSEWMLSVACDCDNPAAPLKVTIDKEGYTVYLELFDWQKDDSGDAILEYVITETVPNKEPEK